MRRNAIGLFSSDLRHVDWEKGSSGQRWDLGMGKEEDIHGSVVANEKSKERIRQRG
jgi:hypothetical protein